MRTLRWYFLAFFIFVTTFCVAQSSVEGVVRTSAGQPVAAALNLSLTHEGVRAGTETVADANGRFHFSAVNGGQYIVKTEAPGYFPARISSWFCVRGNRFPVN